METFALWLEKYARSNIKFGYPDGYGSALYPLAYHAGITTTTFVDMQFRREQEDKAPLDSAIADAAGDRAQADYRAKMGVLPHTSGKDLIQGYTNLDGIDYFWLHDEPNYGKRVEPPPIRKMGFRDYVESRR